MACDRSGSGTRVPASRSLRPRRPFRKALETFSLNLRRPLAGWRRSGLCMARIAVPVGAASTVMDLVRTEQSQRISLDKLPDSTPRQCTDVKDSISMRAPDEVQKPLFQGAFSPCKSNLPARRGSSRTS